MAKTAIVSGANPTLSRGDDPPYPREGRPGGTTLIPLARRSIVSVPPPRSTVQR